MGEWKLTAASQLLSGDLTLTAEVQGARFAKWRSVISIPAGPSQLALQDCAYGLARYAAIAQVRATSCACLANLAIMLGTLTSDRWECGHQDVKI